MFEDPGESRAFHINAKGILEELASQTSWGWDFHAGDSDTGETTISPEVNGTVAQCRRANQIRREPMDVITGVLERSNCRTVLQTAEFMNRLVHRKNVLGRCDWLKVVAWSADPSRS
jgi:hypothetical protein